MQSYNPKTRNSAPLVPLEVGITGGIGAGKSLICKIFSRFKIPIYDADSRAKALMTSEVKLTEQIKKEFGISPCNQDRSLNKKFLSGFLADSNRLKKLNALVHPWVINDYEKWKIRQTKKPYVIKEAALLIEAGTASMLDQLIVVAAPVSLRIKRTLARDPYRTEQDVHNIIKNQLNEEKRIRYADHIIYNDGTRLLLPQIWGLHRLFEEMWKHRNTC